VRAGEDLADLYNWTQEAGSRLEADATEIHELTKRLEDLTKDTPAWYAVTRGLGWRLGRPWSRLRSCVGCWRSGARG
jgi:hypothetical protein